MNRWRSKKPQSLRTLRMKTTTATRPYQRHRYPAEIMSQTISLDHRCSISFRNVEEVMASRAVVPSYEIVCWWTPEFGEQYANDLHEGSNANRPVVALYAWRSVSSSPGCCYWWVSRLDLD